MLRLTPNPNRSKNMVDFQLYRNRSVSAFAKASKGVLHAVVVLLLAQGSASAQEPDTTSALVVAEALVDAFNRHDPANMAALVAPDFELFYVDDDGIAELAIQGPDQLRREMVGYFASHPAVQSAITDAVDGPAFVSFREQIVGGQSSLAVYEVREGLIKRVWYFPAE